VLSESCQNYQNGDVSDQQTYIKGGGGVLGVAVNLFIRGSDISLIVYLYKHATY
jgi:hypothetical protein